MQRIYITLADFEQQFGITPEPTMIGMAFFDAAQIHDSVVYHVFIDESLTSEAALEVKELHRMFKL